MVDRFNSNEEVEFNFEAENQGRLARFHGEPMNKNPYSRNTWLWKSWNAGWCDEDMNQMILVYTYQEECNKKM